MVTDDQPPSILAKAFALLAAFAPDRRVMSLSEIGRASGLPKSTVHRLLARLIELGAIEHHRSGYRVGVALLQMGATAPAMGMRDIASPFLAGLHHRTGLTVHLAILRQFDVVVLERISRRSMPSGSSSIGCRLPAHCTAIGKALLAHEDLDDLDMFLPHPMPSLTPTSVTDVAALTGELARVRRDGVAFEAHQALQGTACLASPVMVMGSPVAAISVAFPAGTAPSQGLVTALRDTSTRIAGEVWAALDGGRVQWFPHEIDQEVDGDVDPDWPAEREPHPVPTKRFATPGAG